MENGKSIECQPFDTNSEEHEVRVFVANEDSEEFTPGLTTIPAEFGNLIIQEAFKAYLDENLSKVLMEETVEFNVHSLYIGIKLQENLTEESVGRIHFHPKSANVH